MSKFYRDLPSSSVGYQELLNVSAQSGSIVDRWGSTLVFTVPQVAPEGAFR